MIKNLRENNNIKNFNIIVKTDNKYQKRVIKPYDVKSPEELIRLKHTEILNKIDLNILKNSVNKTLNKKKKTYSDKQLTEWLVELGKITTGNKQTHIEMLISLKNKHDQIF